MSSPAGPLSMKAKAIAALTACAISLTATSAFLVQSAFAAQEALFNAASVRTVIKKAGIWRLCPETSVSVFGSTVSVSLYRHPGSSETDLKIDAVLMANALSKHFDQMVTELRTHFFESDGHQTFCTVVVPISLVRQYGGGAISQSALLASLRVVKDQSEEIASHYRTMSYKQIMAPSAVVGDYMKKERQEVWRDLESLEKQGYDISLSRAHALAMEDAARRHDWNSVRDQYAIVKTMIPGRLRLSKRNKQRKFVAAKNVKAVRLH